MLVIEIACSTADAGIDEAADADAVADLELRDLRADSGNHTCNFMARHHRVTRIAPFVAGLVDIGMADAAILDGNDDVIVIRFTAFEGEGRQRF